MNNLTFQNSVMINKILKTNNYCNTVVKQFFKYITLSVSLIHYVIFTRARTWIALRGPGGEGITIYPTD